VSGRLRIVLAEDSVLLREGMIRLLQEAGHTVVAAVDNALELVPAVIELRPDVAVVDVRMPPTFTDDGLRAAVEARRVQPGLSVLVLSQDSWPLPGPPPRRENGGAAVRDADSTVMPMSSCRRMAPGTTDRNCRLLLEHAGQTL
jgi:hypothetical protein